MLRIPSRFFISHPKKEADVTPDLTKQTATTLKSGADEIDRLRRENEFLAVKAQAFDMLSSMLALAAPRTPQGYGPDLAWRLRNLAAGIEEQVTGAAAPAGAMLGKTGGEQ
jgi:hypothetical protein